MRLFDWLMILVLAGGILIFFSSRDPAILWGMVGLLIALMLTFIVMVKLEEKQR
jgi:hypothetical protein